MTSVQGRNYLCQKRFFIAPPDFFLPPKSEVSKQLNRPLGSKSSAIATNISKYSKDDLQQIFKTVLEAQTPAPTPTPALTASEEPQDKLLKARSLDVYCEKSHIDCYNFYQQSENYFATARATGANKILFATSFFWDQISFHWQKYKWIHDADSSVPVI